MSQTGLEDLITEGGICLPGTANKIMSGKDYYQMLRAHTIIGNVMSALHWEAFEEWVMEHYHKLWSFPVSQVHALMLMLTVARLGRPAHKLRSQWSN